MSRSAGARLIALLVVALLGVYYIAFDAVGVHVVSKPYTVNVMLPTAGGIYTDASVTYRGVQVGKVAAIDLQPGAVKVQLALDNGTKIPANVNASVKELTAAAEQYMDLVPPGPAGPATTPTGVNDYLASGSVIPEDRTSVPTTVGTLLNSLNSLVNSVHGSDLNTVSTALAQGLNEAGPALRSIIDNGQMLVEALNAEAQPTVAIIQRGNEVLSTLAATGNDFIRFSAGLDQISAQLVRSNSDLMKLLQNGSSGAASLNNLLVGTKAPTVGVINGLSETVGLANARQGAVQAFFQVLPVVANNAALTVSGGNPRFQVQFNTKNTVCPYTSTMAEPTSLVPTLDLTRDCSSSAPDLLQRGANTAPTPPGGHP